MCKIMTITGIKQTKEGDLLKFCKLAKKEMVEHDNDGFGYAATNGKKLWTERWLNTDDALELRVPITQADEDLMDEFDYTVSIDERYMQQGNVDVTMNSAKTVTLHARMSTNVVSMRNVHPFVTEGISLVHNGIISNHETWQKTLSTCDSEAILTKYIKDGLQFNPKAANSLFNALAGYYACSLLVPVNGEYVVDTFKCNSASLSFATIPELGGAKVWVTDAGHLKKVCAFMKWGIPKIFDFDAFSLVRCNATTGKPVGIYVFDSTELETKYNYGGPYEVGGTYDSHGNWIYGDESTEFDYSQKTKKEIMDANQWNRKGD